MRGREWPHRLWLPPFRLDQHGGVHEAVALDAFLVGDGEWPVADLVGLEDRKVLRSAVQWANGGFDASAGGVVMRVHNRSVHPHPERQIP